MKPGSNRDLPAAALPKPDTAYEIDAMPQAWIIREHLIAFEQQNKLGGDGIAKSSRGVRSVAVLWMTVHRNVAVPGPHLTHCRHKLNWVGTWEFLRPCSNFAAYCATLFASVFSANTS